LPAPFSRPPPWPRPLSRRAARPPSPRRAIDGNGVNLVDGSFPFIFSEGTIGSGLGAVSVERHGNGAYGASNWQNYYIYQTVSGSTTTASVVLGDFSENFTSTSGGAFVAASAPRRRSTRATTATIAR